MRRAAVLFAVLVSFIAMESASHAQVPPVLRAGTRPMWAALGLGGAIAVKNAWSQFKLTQEFGYHFNGTSSGPAIVGILQETFGDGFVIFNVGPRFQWDFMINDALGVYLSPNVTMGLGVGGASGYGTDTYAAFNLGFGFRGSMVIGDRGYVFFQPLGFDMNIRGEGVMVRYDLLFGGGATF